MHQFLWRFARRSLLAIGAMTCALLIEAFYISFEQRSFLVGFRTAYRNLWEHSPQAWLIVVMVAAVMGSIVYATAYLYWRRGFPAVAVLLPMWLLGATTTFGMRAWSGTLIHQSHLIPEWEGWLVKNIIIAIILATLAAVFAGIIFGRHLMTSATPGGPQPAGIPFLARLMSHLPRWRRREGEPPALLEAGRA